MVHRICWASPATGGAHGRCAQPEEKCAWLVPSLRGQPLARAHPHGGKEAMPTSARECRRGIPRCWAYPWRLPFREADRRSSLPRCGGSDSMSAWMATRKKSRRPQKNLLPPCAENAKFAFSGSAGAGSSGRTLPLPVGNGHTADGIHVRRACRDSRGCPDTAAVAVGSSTGAPHGGRGDLGSKACIEALSGRRKMMRQAGPSPKSGKGRERRLGPAWAQNLLRSPISMKDGDFRLTHVC